MQILVNTGRHVGGGEALESRIRPTIEAALARFVDRVTRVEVHIDDENSSAKAGDNDKRCTIEARLAGLKPLSATHQAPSISLAVDGAAEKLEQAIGRAIGRLEERRPR